MWYTFDIYLDVNFSHTNIIWPDIWKDWKKVEVNVSVNTSHNIIIESIRQGYTISPGDDTGGELTIKNLGNSYESINLSVEYNSNTSEIISGGGLPPTLLQPIKNWFIIENTTLYIPPYSEEKVSYTIQVPSTLIKYNYYPISNQTFISCINHLHNKETKLIFFDLVDKLSYEWNDNQVQKHNVTYEYNNINISNTSMAEAVEQKYSNNCSIILLINFIQSNFLGITSVDIQRDGNSIDIDCVNNLENLR